MATKLSPGTFFGQTQRKIEVGGLTFAESVYTEGSELYLPPHAHEDAFLHFVIEGVCEEIYGRETRIRSSSVLAFHPAGEPHSNRWHGAGGRVFHIDISRARTEAIREYSPTLSSFDHPAEFDGGVAPWLAGRLYREYRRPEGASRLAMEGLALEILAEASRSASPGSERFPPRWLSRARDLLNDRLSENVTMDEIAAAVNVHPVHLVRSFRRHFGCTPGEYLRRLRVEFACRKLATSRLPLVEVALAAGFADQSHFTKTFRSMMRMTPGEFRRHFGTG